MVLKNTFYRPKLSRYILTYNSQIIIENKQIGIKIDSIPTFNLYY